MREEMIADKDCPPVDGGFPDTTQKFSYYLTSMVKQIPEFSQENRKATECKAYSPQQKKELLKGRAAMYHVSWVRSDGSEFYDTKAGRVTGGAEEAGG